MKACLSEVEGPDSTFARPVHLKTENYVIWYGISLWSVWVTCPDYVPSQDLAHPQPVVREECWRDSLDAV
ncbi:hypothetical protein QYF61_005340 [Mycteria americana]|uniref:Uncharacterized protein n=1 Tax=Mycteria americana TaxID=33587 RepID=A0AAN7RPF0_MYCAM|nr:hypothetical protein QYF61_005340 [Mycteria americana]